MGVMRPASDVEGSQGASTPCAGLDAACTREAKLTPGFEGDHGNRIGQIDAPVLGAHRQTQPVRRIELAQNLVRKPARLRAEHEHVVRGVRDLRVTPRAAGGECKPALTFERCAAGRPRRMHTHRREVVIIEPRALELAILQLEAKRFDQVQTGTRIRAQAYDITRVRWNLRPEKNQVKH